MAPRPPEQTEEYLATIRANGGHLEQLLGDLLDLSRIEAGRLELDPRPCELSDLLFQLSSAFQPLAVERGLRLDFEIATRVPWRFRADLIRIRQVLSNLLSNAIKYTEEGWVRCTVISPDGGSGEEPTRTTVVFEVADSGVGIAPEEQDRLFLPFRQTDDAAARAVGFGLGLSIARELVERMGGEVTVESAPGAGSRFRAAIPVTDCADWQLRPALEPQAGARTGRVSGWRRLRGRVLVVDDSKALQTLCVHVLERWGLDCAVADHGADALAAAAGRSVRPGADGLADGGRRRARGHPASYGAAAPRCRSWRSPLRRCTAIVSAALRPAATPTSSSRSTFGSSTAWWPSCWSKGRPRRRREMTRWRR